MSNPRKDIKKLNKKLKKIREGLKGEVLETAEEASVLIKNRTRNGFGVDDHGKPKKKLKKLSPSYKEARQRDNPPGPTTPAKSNLTYSGDMLDDLEAVKKGNDKAQIRLGTQDSKEKAKHVSEDRPFLNLSKDELEEVRKSLSEKLKKLTNS